MAKAQMTKSKTTQRKQVLHTFSSIGQTDDDIRTLLQLLNRGSAAFQKMSWRRIHQMPVLSQIKYPRLNNYARGFPIVNPLDRMILGLPALVETEPCPTCGRAHNYDCAEKRPVALPGTAKKKTPKRAIVYNGTDTVRIIDELYRVTGKQFKLIDGDGEDEENDCNPDNRNIGNQHKHS